MSEQHLAEIKCLKNRVFSSFLTARSKERENEQFGFFSALWNKLGVWVGDKYRIREYLFPFCFLLILQLLSFPSSLYPKKLYLAEKYFGGKSNKRLPNERISPPTII